MRNHHSHRKLGLSSIITYSVVSFTRYSYLPWLLIYLHNRKYSSWAQVVISYGAILTILQIGIISGKSVSSHCKKLSTSFYSLIFMTLTSSYIVIAFINRFSILMFLFWVIGFTSSILSDFTLSLDGHNPMVIFQKPTHSVDSQLSSITYYREELKRHLLLFSFTTLLGGYLYDPRVCSDFPLYYLSLTVAIVCVLIILYYWILQYTLYKRSSGSTTHSTTTLTHSKHAHSTTTRVKKVLPPYTGKVPVNFLSCCHGNVPKAQAMYGKMLQWREDYDLDNIFTIPQALFDEMLLYYPHGIHGYSLDGCAVVYEVLGKGNIKAALACGGTVNDLLWHFNLRNEYVFRTVLAPDTLQQVIATANNTTNSTAINPPVFPYTPPPNLLSAVDEGKPVPRLMTVIDVEGISISSITTDVISFIKQNGEIIDSYYPEQVARLVICKAPRWFSTIWAVIARVLPEGVKKKVDILYDSQGLDKYIHPSQRPIAYGGTDPNPLGQSPQHLAFINLATQWKIKQQQEQQQQAEEQRKADQLKGSTAASSSASASTASSWKTIDVVANHSSNSSSQKGNNSNGNNGSGVWNWMSTRVTSLVGRNNNNNHLTNTNPNSKPTSAYLGEKNSYVYNPHTCQWELEEPTNTTANNKLSLLNRIEESAEDSDSDSDSSNDSDSESTSSSEEEEEERSERKHLLSISTKHKSKKKKKRSSKSQGTSSGISSKKKGKGGVSEGWEQLEEHGLVLAIHAAHYAANHTNQSPILRGSSSQLFLQSMDNNNNNNNTTNNNNNNTNITLQPSLPSSRDLEAGNNNTTNSSNNNNTSNSNSNGNGNSNGIASVVSSPMHGNSNNSNRKKPFDRSLSQDHLTSSTTTSTTPTPTSSSSSTTTTITPSPNKVPAMLFLLVTGCYCVILSIQQLLLILIPVWWTSSLSSGGLEYHYYDVTLVLSSIAMISYYLVDQYYDLGMMMIRLSPVRALRISTSLLLLVCMVFPYYERLSTVPIVDYLHHYSHSTALPLPLPHLGTGMTSTLTTSMATGMMLHTVGIPPLGYIGNIADHTNGTVLVYQYFTTSLPSVSLVALIVPTVTLSFMLAMLYIALRSVHLMLHLTLTPMFSHPGDIRTTISTVFTVLGPIVCSLIYSLCYHMHWKYPLDTSFHFAFTTCGLLLVYVMSILVRIHFRGDFGIVYDTEELIYHRLYLWGEEDTTLPMTTTHNNHISHTNTNTNTNTNSIWALPLSDWHFLYACIKHGHSSYTASHSVWYGHVKDDFKDV